MKWDLYGEQIEYKEIEQMLAEDQTTNSQEIIEGSDIGIGIGL